ncbi:glucan biosynthesis protein, partial [Salmonella enterica subsp. enterica serovar Anatum]|nr:glucan biosynthesis protein [Salmonella enterica subsp. enterica serovar Anatum]
GFAGFKVLYPINSKDKNDEIVSMLGASYFRVIGAGQVYGLSAQTNILQRQRIGVTGTAISIEQAVSLQFFAGFQMHDDAIIAAF